MDNKPVREVIIPDAVKTNDANVKKEWTKALNRENEPSEAAVEAGYKTTQYNKNFSPGQAMHPLAAEASAVAAADDQDEKWRNTLEGKRLKAAEEKQAKILDHDKHLTITGKEEFKVPKFIEDRETPEQIKQKKLEGQNPNRAPDAALPVPEWQKESKDEAWTAGMSEKVLSMK